MTNPSIRPADTDGDSVAFAGQSDADYYFFQSILSSRLNLDQLVQFMVVVQHMNFTKAANSLFLSHSTVSRNISALEEALGDVRLFVRNNRKVSLTAAGRKLAEWAGPLLKNMEEMIKEVHKAESEVFGVLDLTMVSFYESNVFHTLRQFGVKHPQYHLIINNEVPKVCLRRLASGTTDIAILFSYALENEMSDYGVLPLLSGKFCVVLPEKHPLSGKESIDIHDQRLHNERMLVLGDMDYEFVRNFRKNTPLHSIDRSQSCNSPAALFLSIKIGKGISLLPEHVAAEIKGGCTVLPLTGIDTDYRIVACWHKMNKNQAIPLFLSCFE
jgi:DNA-binding transcriptional LysR family regulator